jgi:hypothetical protein
VKEVATVRSLVGGSYSIRTTPSEFDIVKLAVREHAERLGHGVDMARIAKEDRETVAMALQTQNGLLEDLIHSLGVVMPGTNGDDDE